MKSTMRFWRISNSEGKCWLIPTSNVSVALGLYQPSSFKGRLLKLLLPLFAPFSRLWSPFPLASSPVDSDVIDKLRSVFGNHDIECSFFMGTPSVHQKMTIQIFKRNHILGYCKLSDNNDVIGLFDSEQSLLDFLHERQVPHVPRCLFNGAVREFRLFVMSTEKSPRSSVLHRWTDLHDSFLNELHERTSRTIPFEESDYYKSLQALLCRFDDIPHSVDSVLLRKVIDSVVSAHRGRSLDMSVLHGDFTPWNISLQGDSLFVFDWEYSLSTAPRFLDKCHFLIQSAYWEKHLNAQQIYAYISSDSFSLDRSSVQMYLVFVIAQYVLREPQGVVSSSPMFAIWSQLLTYLNNE